MGGGGGGEDGFRAGPWRQKCEAFSNANYLSPREKEVLLLLVKGRNTSYIEDNLFVSGHTVRAHIYNIYKKTNVHSRQELINIVESFDER
jgi:DNA-binding CsgD family transcriptional regulator